MHLSLQNLPSDIICILFTTILIKSLLLLILTTQTIYSMTSSAKRGQDRRKKGNLNLTLKCEGEAKQEP